MRLLFLFRVQKRSAALIGHLLHCVALCCRLGGVACFVQTISFQNRADGPTAKSGLNNIFLELFTFALPSCGGHSSRSASVQLSTSAEAAPPPPPPPPPPRLNASNSSLQPGPSALPLSLLITTFILRSNFPLIRNDTISHTYTHTRRSSQTINSCPPFYYIITFTCQTSHIQTSNSVTW